MDESGEMGLSRQKREGRGSSNLATNSLSVIIIGKHMYICNNNKPKNENAHDRNGKQSHATSKGKSNGVRRFMLFINYTLVIVDSIGFTSVYICKPRDSILLKLI